MTRISHSDHTSMYIFVDELRLYLGIHDFLLGIQTIIAGKHIADATAEGKIACPLKSKQLDA